MDNSYMKIFDAPLIYGGLLTRGQYFSIYNTISALSAIILTPNAWIFDAAFQSQPERLA